MRLQVATRKGLFVYDLARSEPALVGRHFLGVNVSLSHGDERSGRWYAALDHGHFGVKLHRSQDGGQSWSEIGVPTYPKRAPDAKPEISADGQVVPWDLKRIWALASGAAHEDGRLWCGTLPGGLFTSDDHGDHWQLNQALWRMPERLKWAGGGADYPGIHSICVDPRDSRTVRIAVSCGGVWITTDGGASWRVTSQGLFAEYMPPEGREDPIVQDPHLMRQCPAEPDRLWIQHHNGVFQSRDGARTWQHCADVPPHGNGFGFAVAVHPKRGDTAWLIPAIKDEARIPMNGSVVVTRTTDGGGSWEVLSEGLPQVDAYDLVYRHALDVDLTGECLAFGSTTGSLWLSRDAGSSWRELNAHLPPIHAVRMVS